MVGTAAAKVTFSDSISSYSEAPSILAPGSTSLAPAIGTLWARPQQLAWNIGTTGMITSLAEMPIMLGMVAIMAWRTLERCE